MLLDRPIPIPMKDDLPFANEQPVSSEPAYSDKVDPAFLSEVAQQVRDGLLTPEEATRTVQGRQL